MNACAFLSTCSQMPSALERVLASGTLKVVTRNAPTRLSLWDFENVFATCQYDFISLHITMSGFYTNYFVMLVYKSGNFDIFFYDYPS